MGLSLLAISRQIIGQANPRQPVVNPGVIGRRHCRRLVKAANGNIDLVRVWLSNKCQRCAAMRTKRTRPLGPAQLSRLSGGEPKLVPTKRCPGHERCATALAT